MIPDTIHYCWFGGGSKPQLVVECIESWRRFMPGWEIVEWNESNFDVSKNLYMREAHAERMWAFVSDYARFDVLLEHGGIYVDTDVELLRPVPEWVLGDSAFTGLESGGTVSPGLMFGAEPGLPIIAEILESYEGSHFDGGGSSRPQTVNDRVTRLLKPYGFETKDSIQRVAGITIYPSEYFCGYDQDVHQVRVSDRTISVHHYAHSWGTQRERLRLRVQQAAHAILGPTTYRRLLEIKRRILGVRET